MGQPRGDGGHGEVVGGVGGEGGSGMVTLLAWALAAVCQGIAVWVVVVLRVVSLSSTGNN
jgi:hypothetical protein